MLVDCPANYSLEEINASAAKWDGSNASHAALQAALANTAMRRGASKLSELIGKHVNAGNPAMVSAAGKAKGLLRVPVLYPARFCSSLHGNMFILVKPLPAAGGKKIARRRRFFSVSFGPAAR